MSPPAHFTGLTVLGVSPGKGTPRCRIATDFQADLSFSDGARETCWFTYHKSGASRDTWVVVGKSWLLKGEPHVPQSASLQEWTAWSARSALPLPTVYGFLTCSVEGVSCDFLLMDWVAFTFWKMK